MRRPTLSVYVTALLLASAADGASPGPDATCVAPLVSGEGLQVQDSAPSAGPPSIIAGLTANAASGETGVCRGFAPGSLVRIFGRGFATGEHRADRLLFFGRVQPLRLGCLDDGSGCTVVRIDGVAAPITYLSSSQAVVQIPWETVGPTATLVVESPAGTSEPAAIPIASRQPGLFPDRISSGACIPEAPGCGSGPRAGGILELEGTGFGAVEPVVPTGNAGQLRQYHWVTGAVAAWVDDRPVAAHRAHLLGFKAGVYGVVLYLPDHLEPGPHTARIAIGEAVSNVIAFVSE